MEARYIKHTKKSKYISPTRQIAFSFLMVILIGSLLLWLPFSNKGKVPYLDHLFVATSATCVTGLVPVVVKEQYTLIGQLIIIILIQIGGLGFLTFLNLLYVKMKKKISYKNKIIMQEALNQNSVQSITIYIKRVIKYTFSFELIGACCLAFVFVPELGLIKGIYYSLFHAISAFCNAGFDILGSNSLIPYQSNLLLNLTIAGLIIAGGLGFIVWIEIREHYKQYKEKFKIFNFKKYASSFTIHTKIVLIFTFVLLLSGTLFFFILEYNNPKTLGPLPLTTKLLVSFFQSVTFRTAGFASVAMGDLLDSTKLLSCFYMFIGGSPAGTAGGIKTTTFIIILFYIHSLAKGVDQVSMMKRTISEQVAKRAICISVISFFIVINGLLILTLTEDKPFIDLVFETFSAFGTVGVTANVTPTLTSLGKIIVILLMYIGRIGPLTMVFIFIKQYTNKEGKGIIYPSGEILIG